MNRTTEKIVQNSTNKSQELVQESECGQALSSSECLALAVTEVTQLLSKCNLAIQSGMVDYRGGLKRSKK